MKQDNINILKCKKISILGPSCSGKSTLAIKLGEILNLPVYHIDTFAWKPNWEKLSKKDLAKQIKKVSKQKKWIIEGNYLVTLINRFKRSDLIIVLNFSEEFCINAVKERFKKGKEQRAGFPSYLEESEAGITKLFDSIRKFTRVRIHDLLELKEKYAKNKMIEFKNRDEVNKFIKELTLN